MAEEYMMGVNHTKDIFETSMDWATPTHKLTALVRLTLPTVGELSG
jgi:hypothetical protein